MLLNKESSYQFNKIKFYALQLVKHKNTKKCFINR